MKIKPVEMANISLVEIDELGYPRCILHGAMNKVSKEGIWRCITTHTRTLDNGCRAGCMEVI